MKIPGFLFLALLATFALAAGDPRPPKVFLIGGSTMATFAPDFPKPGWGQSFPRFFADPSMVRNHASSGRSSKLFIDEGRWAKVLGEMEAGDYLIIHFGTNDSKKSDPTKFVEPRGGFRVNLERFVREARGKGAHPILATSLARRAWDEKGAFVDDGSEYVVVTREVAAALDVPLLEMRLRSMELEKSLGPEGSIRLHAYLEPGAHKDFPKGLKDNTHYSPYGSERIAALVAQELRRIGHPLARWLRETPATASR